MSQSLPGVAHINQPSPGPSPACGRGERPIARRDSLSPRERVRVRVPRRALPVLSNTRSAPSPNPLPEGEGYGVGSEAAGDEAGIAETGLAVAEGHAVERRHAAAGGEEDGVAG